MPEDDHGLGNLARHHDNLVRVPDRDIRDPERRRFFGQGAEGAIQQGHQLGLGNVADHTDNQVVAGEATLDEIPQIIGRNLADGPGLAIHIAAVGVAAEDFLVPAAPGDIAGTFRLARDLGHYLAFHARYRLRIEARPGQGKLQKAEGQVTIFRQRTQGPTEGIEGGAKTERDGIVFQTALEPGGGQIARALVQQAGDKLRHAVLALGIKSGAAAKGEFHGDKGNGLVLDQPCGQTLGGLDLLDLDGARPMTEPHNQHQRATGACAPTAHARHHHRLCSFGARPVSDRSRRLSRARAPGSSGSSRLVTERSGRST